VASLEVVAAELAMEVMVEGTGEEAEEEEEERNDDDTPSKRGFGRCSQRSKFL
jgi:hypothetical protein